MLETIATIGWIVLIIFISFMTVRIIVNTIRTERKRKAYAPNIKPGDQVIVPVMDRYFGEVLEVGEDEVKIIVTSPKNRVYQK